MAIYIDRKYLLLLSPKLENFKQKNTNLFSFRCCYCGDSQKDKSKSRGFVYCKNNQYLYTCFNCDKGTTLKSLIKFIDPYLEKEYILENFQENPISKRKVIMKHVIPLFKSSVSKIDLPTIASLPEYHFAKKYIIDRKIPEFFFNILYYSKDFKEFVESVSDKQLDRTGPRIVIPFFSKSGELIAFQGRALDSYSMRYITVKLNREHDKLFGLDRIDISKPIKVCEGPLDSLFLPNCIATADSNLAAAANLFDKSNLILIPDNEPRNLSIVQNIEKFIKNNFTVCLLPDLIKQKDINDMILSGMSRDNIIELINDHSYSGLRANIEFIKWRKV